MFAWCGCCRQVTWTQRHRDPGSAPPDRGLPQHRTGLNDQNLRELAGHISSHLLHNGFIDGFAAIKRDLVLAVNDPLFERGQIAVAVLQPRRPHGQRAISRTTCPAAAVRRRRFVVSEPIGDLPGTWVELPEASYGVFRKGVTSSCPSPPDHHRKPSYGRRASQPPSQARQAVMEPVPSSAGLRRVPPALPGSLVHRSLQG